MTKVEDSVFPKGVWVSVPDEDDNRIYRVKRNLLNADGSLTVYGGDRSKGGHQAYRAIMPDRLRLATAPPSREDES